MWEEKNCVREKRAILRVIDQWPRRSMDSTKWGNAAFSRLPQIRSAAVKGGGKTYHWVS